MPPDTFKRTFLYKQPVYDSCRRRDNLVLRGHNFLCPKENEIGYWTNCRAGAAVSAWAVGFLTFISLLAPTFFKFSEVLLLELYTNRTVPAIIAPIMMNKNVSNRVKLFEYLPIPILSICI